MMEREQAQPCKILVNLGVMAMKKHSTLTKSPEFEHHYRMQVSYSGHPILEGTVNIFQASLTEG